MLWLATVAAVAGWTAAGVWMALWWRQRRHVRIALAGGEPGGGAAAADGADKAGGDGDRRGADGGER